MKASQSAQYTVRFVVSCATHFNAYACCPMLRDRAIYSLVALATTLNGINQLVSDVSQPGMHTALK